jgi:phosphoglycerate-specific signal transduction histidine kinase
MLLTGCGWFDFYIFHVVDRWLQLFTRLNPTSVQIKAGQVAPAIAIDDAVRI